MPVNRPPLTEDQALNSWMYEITDAVSRQDVTTQQVSESTGDGTPGPQGVPGSPGVSSATLVLYKRSDVIPLPAEEDLATELTYTYSTGTFNIAEPDGWSREYPPAIEGRAIFAIQVNVADTNDQEVIPANAWSDPVLILKDTDVVTSRIATNNGTALRSGGFSTTTLKAVVSRNGDDQNDIAHLGYNYKWTVPGGSVVCVDSNRNVINDGENPMVATGSEGSLVCAIGTPADSNEPADIHGSNLREITVGSEDVDKSQQFELEVSNIPE